MNDVNNVFIEDWALSLGLFIFSTNETSRQQKSVLIKLSDPSGNCASAITKGQVAGCVPCCQQPAFSLAPSTERRHHSLYHNLDKSVIFFCAEKHLQIPVFSKWDLSESGRQPKQPQTKPNQAWGSALSSHSGEQVLVSAELRGQRLWCPPWTLGTISEKWDGLPAQMMYVIHCL